MKSVKLTSKKVISKNIIKKDIFDNEIAICKNLSKKNGGKCNWWECSKCWVLPLLYKLHKWILIEKSDEIKTMKSTIL